MACVSVYEASCDERWLREAVRLADLMIEWFADRSGGGFFFTASDHEQLLTRQKDLYDNATPSGNGMAATALVRLARLTGKSEYVQTLDGVLQAALGVIERSPTAGGQLLLAYDMLVGPTQEIVIVGNPDHADTAALLAEIAAPLLAK